MSAASGAMNASAVVAGLVNFGNTCYANSLLQALSSCQSYYEYMKLVRDTFPIPQNYEVFDATWKSDNWRACLPLSSAITCCLDRLQPSYTRRPSLASALEVLHGVGRHDRRLFSGFGEQQDVGEVLDCMVASSREELRVWKQVFLPDRTGMAQLHETSAVAPGDAKHPRIVRNTSQKLHVISSSEMHSFSVSQFQSLGAFDGMLAHSLECCECGHMFDMHLNPFTLLMLPIPSMGVDPLTSSIEAEISLEDCLQDYFSTKRQGPIRCPKCSLRCTVSCDSKAESVTSVGSFGRQGSYYPAALSSFGRSSEEEEFNNCLSRTNSNSHAGKKPCGLGDLLTDISLPTSPAGGVVYRSLASFDIKEFKNNTLKPSTSSAGMKEAVVKEALSAVKESVFREAHAEDFAEKLQKVGVRWIPSESHVHARAAIAKLPKVLAISLQRRVFDGLAFRKIQGVVRYPLVLNMSDYLQFSSVHCSKYRLKAVVVHQGNENSGHYMTVRSIQSADGKTAQWVLATDDKVHYISEEMAVGMEASVLFYERDAEQQQQNQPRPQKQSQRQEDGREEEEDGECTSPSFISLYAPLA